MFNVIHYCRFNGSSLVEVQPLFINNTNEPSCPFVPPPVCPTTSCPMPTATRTSCPPSTSNTFTCPTFSTACPTPSFPACPACASSVGTTAGVGIGLLIVGLIIGLVVGIVLCFFVQRRRNSGSFEMLNSPKYDRQFDDVTT